MSSFDDNELKTIKVFFVETGKSQTIPIESHTCFMEFVNEVAENYSLSLSEHSTDSSIDVAIFDENGYELKDFPEESSETGRPIFVVSLRNTEDNSSVELPLHDVPSFQPDTQDQGDILRAVLTFAEASKRSIQGNLEHMKELRDAALVQQTGFHGMAEMLESQTSHFSDQMREVLQWIDTSRAQIDRCRVEDAAKSLKSTQLPQSLESGGVLMDLLDGDICKTNKDLLDQLKFRKNELMSLKSLFSKTIKNNLKRIKSSILDANNAVDMARKYESAESKKTEAFNYLDKETVQVKQLLEQYNSLSTLSGPDKADFWGKLELYFHQQHPKILQNTAEFSQEVRESVRSAHSLVRSTSEQLNSGIGTFTSNRNKINEYDRKLRHNRCAVQKFFEKHFPKLKAASELPNAYEVFSEEVTRRSRWNVSFTDRMIETNRMFKQECDTERNTRVQHLQDAREHLGVLKKYPTLASYFANALYCGSASRANNQQKLNQLIDVAVPKLTGVLKYRDLPSDDDQSTTDNVSTNNIGWDRCEFSTDEREDSTDVMVDSAGINSDGLTNSFSSDEAEQCGTSGTGPSNASYASSVKIYKAKLEEADQRVSQLEQELDRYRFEMESCQKEAEEEKHKAQETAKSQKNQVEQLQNELQKTKEMSQEQHASVNDALAEMEQNLASMRKDKTALERQSEEQKQDIEDLCKNLYKTRTENQELLAENQRLNILKEQRESEIYDLNQMIEELSRELDQVKQEQQEAEKDKRSVMSQTEAQQQDSSKLEEQLEELEKEYAVKMDYIERLKSTMQTERVQYEAEIQNLTRMRDDERQYNEAQRIEHEEAIRSAQQLEQSLVQHEREIESLKQQLASVREENSNVCSIQDFNQVMEELSAVKQVLENQMRCSEQFKTENAELKHELETKQLQLEELEASNEALVEEVQNHLHQLEKQKLEYNNAAEAKQTETINALQRKLEDVEECLRDTECFHMEQTEQLREELQAKECFHMEQTDQLREELQAKECLHMEQTDQLREELQAKDKLLNFERTHREQQDQVKEQQSKELSRLSAMLNEKTQEAQQSLEVIQALRENQQQKQQQKQQKADPDVVEKLQQQLNRFRRELEQSASDKQGLLDSVSKLRAEKNVSDDLRSQLLDMFHLNAQTASNDVILSKVIEETTSSVHVVDNGSDPEPDSRLVFAKRGTEWAALRASSVTGRGSNRDGDGESEKEMVYLLSEEVKQSIAAEDPKFVVGTVVFCDGPQMASGDDGSGLPLHTPYYRVHALIEQTLTF